MNPGIDTRETTGSEQERRHRRQIRRIGEKMGESMRGRQRERETEGAGKEGERVGTRDVISAWTDEDKTGTTRYPDGQAPYPRGYAR